MEILDPGHFYRLNVLDAPNQEHRTVGLKFVKRFGPAYSGNEDAYPGTNCQEVLAALIDRTTYLNSQDCCAETEAIIGLLKSAYLLFELRAARRHGQMLGLETLSDLTLPSCEVCGHIRCFKEHEEEQAPHD